MSQAVFRLPDDALELEAWERLRMLVDPELGVNVVDLGLIYELGCRAGAVHVLMSLTTPGCPLSGSMPEAVEHVLATVPGVSQVQVELVWEPPWQPEMISARGRRELGWR